MLLEWDSCTLTVSPPSLECDKRPYGPDRVVHDGIQDMGTPVTTSAKQSYGKPPGYWSERV